MFLYWDKEDFSESSLSFQIYVYIYLESSYFFQKILLAGNLDNYPNLSFFMMQARRAFT